MTVNVARSVQESCDIDRISMARISELVREIILHARTFSNSK